MKSQELPVRRVDAPTGSESKETGADGRQDHRRRHEAYFTKTLSKVAVAILLWLIEVAIKPT